MGVQRVAKAFAPFLKQSKAAKLVFLSTVSRSCSPPLTEQMNSSIAGIDECDRLSREIFGRDRPAGRTPAYSISKAALNMAAQQWARALPDVVVIAIHPCVVRPLTRLIKQRTRLDRHEPGQGRAHDHGRYICARHD